MKKKQRRMLAGLICIVLFFADIIPTGFQVTASEIGQDDSGVNTGVFSGGSADVGGEDVSSDDMENGKLQEESDGIEDGEEKSEENPEEDNKEDGEELREVNNEGNAGVEDSNDNNIEDETIDSEAGEEDSNIGEAEKNEDKEVADTDDTLIGDAEKRLVLMASSSDIASGTYGNIAWIIDKNGKLTVEGTGDFSPFPNLAAPWYDYRESIKSAEISVTGMTNASSMFYNCSNLTSVDISGLNTSQVKYMSLMFANCSSLKDLDVSGLDTSQVTDMTQMFGGSNSLKYLDVSGFNTSKVTDMSDMFINCSSLTELDVSGFNTSKVTNMSWMFAGCNGLRYLDVGSFDTSQVTDMSWMFYGCSALQSLNLSEFDTVNVKDVSRMLDGCTDLSTIYTPYNLNVSADLPTNYGDIWYRYDGSTITELPKNLSYSIVLGRNYIPYAQNLTKISLKNANEESKESINNAIYNLLFKAEYRPTESKISGDTMKFTGSTDTIKKWPIQNIHYETKVYWNKTVVDANLGSITFNNAAAGCMSYAYFVSTYIYSTCGTKKTSYNINASGVKEFIRQYADPGEHLRYKRPHSIVFLGESSDGDGFYYINYDGGADGKGAYHNLYLAEYTSYGSFASEVKKYGNYLYIYDTNGGSYYNGTAKTVADVRNGNGAKKIVTRIACPVEATIELNDEILDSRTLGTASFGTVERDGDEIVFNLEYSPDYNLTIIGTDEGTMTLTLEYYDGSESLIDKRMFVEMPIGSDTEIISSGFDSQSTFVLYSSDGTDEIEAWGAGINETAYSSDDLQRGDNESKDDLGGEDIPSEDNPDSEDVFPDDIPSDGIIPDGIWSAGITDTIYNGSNITQSFRLYDGNRRLQEQVDYTVSYKNNKTAYTYTEEDYATFESNLLNTGKPTKFGSFDPNKAPQVVIKMKGNYSGSRTIYFKIQPANITDDGFTAANLSATYSGKKQTPSPILTWNGKALKYGTDFYVPEYDNAKNDKKAFSESKTYDLTIVGKNNFTGEIPITLTISANDKQIAMSSVTISGISSQAWTGQQIMPNGYTVKYKTDVLSEANGDYTVSIGENIAVGTGTITLIGTGTDNDGDGYSYIGTKTVSFKITGTAMSKVTVAGVDKSYTYTGSAIEPSAMLTYRVNKNAVPFTLVENTHYTVAYQKNQDKGTATIIFTGLESGGYTGTKKTTFKIAAGGIADKTEGGSQIEQIRIAFKDTENVRDGIYVAPYMKGGANPEIIVTGGDKTLALGKDYTVSYANNKKVALSTDAKAPTITVRGKGNYSGSKKVNFTIAAKPLSEENGITVAAKDKVVSTKRNGYRQSFKVYDTDGKALGSSDYDSKTVIYTLIQTENENGAVNTVNEVLDNNSVVPANSVIRITVQGKGNYAGGSVSGTYRILQANHDISNATIQINNQTYTGQPVTITDQSQFKPGKVYIKIGNEKKELILGKDIEVVSSSYVKNVNKGTAKVTFRGINDFGGTKTVSYKIGTRSIADFWKGVFSKISGLMAYIETPYGLPEQNVRMI